MKFLRKISIFLLTAALFMSAFVVFAENTSTPPTLAFKVNISRANRLEDSTVEGLKAKINLAIGAPFYALTRDYPDLAMWTNGCNVSSSISSQTTGTRPVHTLTSLEYTLLPFESFDDPKGMYDQLRSIVDAFTPVGDTMYDKLVSIHDYICQINTYVSNAPYCYSAYGALVDRQSVCEGYAEAFKLLCDKIGVDCILVTGLSPSAPGATMGNHMWNLVRMDDGEWYAVDVTWDDAGDIVGNYSYFLIGADTVVKGMTFTESHVTTYDFVTISGSDKTIPSLQYPTISSVPYDKENGKIDYEFGGESFHYDFLDDLQKEIYDAMLNALRTNMPSNPSEPPSSDTTDTAEPSVSTTDPSTTTPEESTTPPEVSTTPEETTTIETTTPPPSTTPEESTTPTESTTPPDSTTVSTTAPDETTKEDTTESDTSSPESSTKPTVITTTEKTTEPPISSTNEETPPPKTDVSSLPDQSSSITTALNDNDAQAKEIQNLYEIVTTTVIVCSITCLAIALVFFVIKFARKYKED